jgi:hypothetical protein
VRRLLVLTLAACGASGPSDAMIPIEPHAHVACDDIWTANGFTDCEEACVDATTALNAMGAGCAAATSSGPVTCQKTFKFRELTGCCASSEHTVLFAECL